MVEVIEVLVNGNLVICGEKWFILNMGDEYICFSGIICLDDIDFDNMIVFNCIFNV